MTKMKKARSVTAPGKFYLNKGLFRDMPEYTEILGEKPYIIADPFIYEKIRDEIGKKYHTSEIVEFGGENSQSEIEKHKNQYEESETEFIIGIGGGKAMDNARAVAYKVDAPLVIFPTLAATDAAATSVSVLYSEEGEFEKYLFLPNNPDIVLADLDILVTTPPDHFSAGMADTMASWIEGRVTFHTDGDNLTGNRSSYTGYSLEKLGYDTIRKYGIQALQAAKNNIVTEAFSRVIEASIWISGVGAEAGGITSAHALHNGVTAVLDMRKHDAKHGEIVAFGMIVTLILEGASDEEVYDLANFFKEIELPLTLEDLDLKGIEEDKWRQVAEKTCDPEDTTTNMAVQVTPDDVYQSILLADKVMQQVKEGYKLN